MSFDVLNLEVHTLAFGIYGQGPHWWTIIVGTLRVIASSIEMALILNLHQVEGAHLNHLTSS